MILVNKTWVLLFLHVITIKPFPQRVCRNSGSPGFSVEAGWDSAAGKNFKTNQAWFDYLNITEMPLF